MARPKFTPDAEQQRTLAALSDIAASRAKLDDDADQLIATAAAQKIPVTHVAKALRVERKTVYRHAGRHMR